MHRPCLKIDVFNQSVDQPINQANQSTKKVNQSIHNITHSFEAEAKISDRE